MNEEQVISIVAEELKRIWRGPDDDIQHELRVLFSSQRKADLARGLTRTETISYCIDSVARMYPGWEPNVDKDYFDLE